MKIESNKAMETTPVAVTVLAKPDTCHSSCLRTPCAKYPSRSSSTLGRIMKQTIEMDLVKFDVPRELECRTEDGTLVICSDGSVILRCSVTSVMRHGEEVDEVARNEIPELAHEAGLNYEVFDEKLVLRSRQRILQEDREDIFRWYMGLGGHIAVLSISTKDGIECAESIIESFRRK
jgi:hypothetical protein